MYIYIYISKTWASTWIKQHVVGGTNKECQDAPGNMVEDCLVNSFASRQHWPLYSYFVFILGTCKCTSASFDTTLLQECDLTTRRSQLVTTHLHTALPTWNQNDSHFFLQNPVLQTGRWSWLLAPSDVATPLRLPPTSPLPLLSLLHLLRHHCECFLERVTGGELVNLKIEAVVTESELSWL